MHIMNETAYEITWSVPRNDALRFMLKIFDLEAQRLPDQLCLGDNADRVWKCFYKEFVCNEHNDSLTAAPTWRGRVNHTLAVVLGGLPFTRVTLDMLLRVTSKCWYELLISLLRDFNVDCCVARSFFCKLCEQPQNAAKVVDKMIRYGVCDVDTLGCNPACLAIRVGNAAITYKLLKWKPELANVESESGLTCFETAVLHGQLAIAQHLLLEMGSKLSAQAGSRTVLELFCDSVEDQSDSYCEILTFLIEKLYSGNVKALNRALIAACKDPKNPRFVKELIEAGARVVVIDNQSALTHATTNPEIMTALVKHVELQSKSFRQEVLEHVTPLGHTALMLAAKDTAVESLKGGCRATAAQLLSAGADPYKTDENGDTALKHLLLNVPELLATALCSMSKDQALDAEGNTLLHVLAMSPRRSYDYFKLAHRSWHRATARNIKGDTPLHILARSISTDGIQPGDIRIIEFLVNKGAGLTLVNADNMTPIQLCREQWIKQLLEEL